MGNELDSYMIEDPVARAKRWIEEYEKMKKLEEENRELERKAKCFDAIVESKMIITISDCADKLGLTTHQFTEWLISKGYMYHDYQRKLFLPCSEHCKEGLFLIKADFNSNINSYITVKGLETFRLLLDIGNYTPVTEC